MPTKPTTKFQRGSLMRGTFVMKCLFTALIGILAVGITILPRATATDTPPQAFGAQGSVNDDANYVLEWVENGTNFAWGPAPSWASYCDIRQINASENAGNYSIAVVLASAANYTRFIAGFAGIRVDVNLTAAPAAPADLQLVIGGHLFTYGEVAGHLSYGVLNDTKTFALSNITDIATMTDNDTVVNFSFPKTFLGNITALPPLVVPLAQWSVIVYTWDFFNSTAQLPECRSILGQLW